MSLLEILNRVLWKTVLYKKWSVKFQIIHTTPIYNSSELWGFSVLELSGIFVLLYSTVQYSTVCVCVCIIFSMEVIWTDCWILESQVFVSCPNAWFYKISILNIVQGKECVCFRIRELWIHIQCMTLSMLLNSGGFVFSIYEMRTVSSSFSGMWFWDDECQVPTQCRTDDVL